MKSAIKAALRASGFEIRRIRAAEPASPVAAPPGPSPIGDLPVFLNDLKTRGFRPRGIVDVGANYGHWARHVLSVFPEAPIIMIEPQDEMEPHMREILASHPGCHYVKAGAAREPGELIQTIWQDLAGSSFLPEIEAGQIETGRQRKTRMVTLDEVLNVTYPDFVPELVKLDIQGFELEALSGGESLFGKTEVFIIETSLFRFLPRQPITREIIGFMADRGYELYDITEFLRRPLDGALGQVDLAFVKADGRFRTSAAW
jgi:FkbM family methyltransferase